MDFCPRSCGPLPWLHRGNRRYRLLDLKVMASAHTFLNFFVNSGPPHIHPGKLRISFVWFPGAPHAILARPFLDLAWVWSLVIPTEYNLHGQRAHSSWMTKVSILANLVLASLWQNEEWVPEKGLSESNHGYGLPSPGSLPGVPTIMSISGVSEPELIL